MGIRAHKSFAIQLDSVKTVGLCPICSMRTGTVCLSCSPVIPSPSSARRTVGTQRSLLDEGVDECSAWRDGETEKRQCYLTLRAWPSPGRLRLNSVRLVWTAQPSDTVFVLGLWTWFHGVERFPKIIAGLLLSIKHTCILHWSEVFAVYPPFSIVDWGCK